MPIHTVLTIIIFSGTLYSIEPFCIKSWSLLKRSPTKWHIVWEILVRGAKLSFLGICVVGGGSHWDTIRLPGVLQRIAVGYCVVSLIHLASPNVDKAPTSIKQEFGWFWPEHLVAHFLLATFCMVTYCLPLPNNCPTGDTGPGGISENGQYAECIGGAARYIDELVFGKHVYWWGSVIEKRDLVNGLL